MTWFGTMVDIVSKVPVGAEKHKIRESIVDWIKNLF